MQSNRKKKEEEEEEEDKENKRGAAKGDGSRLFPFRNILRKEEEEEDDGNCVARYVQPMGELRRSNLNPILRHIFRV